MDWYAPIAKQLVHPLWALKDGEKHIAFWKQLERSQYLSQDGLYELQLMRLKTILTHAYENCDFYRKRFSEAGLAPSDIRTLSDVQYIPFLTKEDIQNHKEEMVDRNIPQRDLLQDKTGGSTGKPLQYCRDKRRMDYLRAAAMRHDRWAGYEVGDKLAVIWGNRHDFSMQQALKWKIRNRLLDRKLILDSSCLTEEGMVQFARSLRAFAPKVMLAYANSCAFFASFILDNNLNGIHLDSAITSAEVLHEHERELIERAFGCKVFNRYGCREVGVIASECEAHDGLHINAECLLVEFVRDGKAVAPGEAGDVVITDLLNFGMPFIRYRIEDIGISGIRRCTCGRSLPLMETVAGRVTDFLMAPDGRRISGASLTIYLVANTPGIGQAQIVQESHKELRLRIVRKSDFNKESEAFIQKKVKEFFGSDMHLTYEFLNDIPKEPSGKYRFSICMVK
jgi:phenylacetate-CoA ligase